jgi:hypothetical protein
MKQVSCLIHLGWPDFNHYVMKQSKQHMRFGATLIPVSSKTNGSLHLLAWFDTAVSASTDGEYSSAKQIQKDWDATDWSACDHRVYEETWDYRDLAPGVSDWLDAISARAWLSMRRRLGRRGGTFWGSVILHTRASMDVYVAV